MIKSELTSIERQGVLWINGVSTHNYVRDECCPDFSCCFPVCFEPKRAKRIETHNNWARRYGVPEYKDD